MKGRTRPPRGARCRRRVGPGRWRVGLTKFATRMLGEMVDHGLEIEPGTPVECGQIIGWVEGFKAISDLFCVADGRFLGSNPALKERMALMTKDPFGAGWVYEVEGATIWGATGRMVHDLLGIVREEVA